MMKTHTDQGEKRKIAKRSHTQKTPWGKLVAATPLQALLNPVKKSLYDRQQTLIIYTL